MDLADFERFRDRSLEIIQEEMKKRSVKDRQFLSCIPLGLQCIILLPEISQRSDRMKAERDRFKAALSKIEKAGSKEDAQDLARMALGR